MSILPQLEGDLRKAAERRLGAGEIRTGEISLGEAGTGRTVGTKRGSGQSIHERTQGLRLAILTFVVLLAGTTIALAATGVILSGKPVQPEELRNPGVGEGIPAAGSSRLLPLRVPDPAGGLPWGMRIVHTTRGELCVQIGRVQDGQLGELGIDGNFHDDARFHPLPADALPRDISAGSASSQVWSDSASCQLAGQPVEGAHLGVLPSAAARAKVSASPARELRDLYFGVLGPHAVSISYSIAGTEHTESVLAPTGAYLIVTRPTPGQNVGAGFGGYGLALTGTNNLAPLTPSPPLTAITYRFARKLCYGGPFRPRGATLHTAGPCPAPALVPTPPNPTRMQKLHRPLHLQLLIRNHVVTGATLSFTAPFAVTSASSAYSYAISTKCATRQSGSTQRFRGGIDDTLARDVRRGAVVNWRIGNPFAYSCARRSASIAVFYGRSDAGGLLFGTHQDVLVGATTITAPAGTLAGSRQWRLPRRRTHFH